MGNYAEIYPERGLSSLYPGSTTVVAGQVYGKEVRRLDLTLEIDLNRYQIGLLGSRLDSPKALCDAAQVSLEHCLAEAARLNRDRNHAAGVRAQFSRSFYNVLIPGELCSKTDFSGFTTPGKIYIAFSQFRYR